MAMADPVEEKLLHMVTADPAADADVHAVRAGRLLPQRVVDDDADLHEQRPRRTASSCRTRRRRTRRSRGTTAASSRRSRRRGSAGSGPGVEKKGETRRRLLVRPHRHPADDARAARAEGRLRRPTAASITEFLKGDALPKSLNGGTASRSSAQAYKQINASFGQFSLDTLIASTGALASNTLGDTTYTRHGERSSPQLGAERDALAAQIRAGALERRVQRPEDRREAGEGLDRPGRRPARPGGRARREVHVRA